jgi:hypothetical protein
MAKKRRLDGVNPSLRTGGMAHLPERFSTIHYDKTPPEAIPFV